MNHFITRTYWINGLYPNNPSMNEELNRLLGWTNYGNNTMMTCNEFVQNGTDSEYCPDDNSISSGTSHGNNSSSGLSTRPNSEQLTQPQPQPSPPRQIQPFQQNSSGQISSSIFLNANRGRRTKSKKLHCSFCKNNGEREMVFASHNLKTDNGGKVICPVLRNYTCPICGVNGDDAHTLKYCPMRERV